MFTREMVSEYNINTANMIKLNYLVKIMKFQAMEIDEFTLNLKKGQKIINIHYDKSQDLYDVELIKLNSINAILKGESPQKSSKKIRSIFWEDVRENLENHYNTQIYNLL